MYAIHCAYYTVTDQETVNMDPHPVLVSGGIVSGKYFQKVKI